MLGVREGQVVDVWGRWDVGMVGAETGCGGAECVFCVTLMEELFAEDGKSKGAPYIRCAFAGFPPVGRVILQPVSALLRGGA